MFVKLEPEPGKKRNRTEIGKRRLKFSFQAAFFCKKRAGGDCGRISYSFSKPVIKVIRIEIAQKKDGQSSLFSGTDSFILIIQRKSFQIRYFHQPAVLQTIARNLNAMRPYQYLRVHPPVFGEWLVSAAAYFFSLYLYFHQPAVLQTIARNLNAMRPYQYLRVHPPVFGEWLVSAAAYFFSLYLIFMS